MRRYDMMVLDSDSDYSESELQSYERYRCRSTTEQSNLFLERQRIPTRSRQLAFQQEQWDTISLSEFDPIWYVALLKENESQLQRQLEEDQNYKTALAFAENEANSAVVSKQNDKELSYPQLPKESEDDQLKDVAVEKDSLTSLLCSMFDRKNVPKATIESIVDSLDCSIISLQQLNECVSTLLALSAEDNNQFDRFPIQNLSSNGGNSLWKKTTGNTTQDLYDSQFEDTSNDAAIALQLAADDSYPKAASKKPFSKKQKMKKIPLDLSSNASKNDVLSPSSSSSYAWGKTATKAQSLSSNAVVSPGVSPKGNTKRQVEALKNSFPKLDPDIINECFTSYDYCYGSTLAYLKEVFSDYHVPNSNENVIHRDLPSPGKIVASRSTVSYLSSKSRHENDPEVQYESLIPFTECEKEIGMILDNKNIPSDYFNETRSDNERQEALAHANRREALFQAAAVAFLSGRGSEAKKYAQLGKEEGDRMSKSNTSAMFSNFRRQNAFVDSTRKIDLHYLYAKEAICLVHFICTRQRRKGFKELTFVTGRGNHSKQKNPILKPVVENYCRRYSLKYWSINDAAIKIQL